MSSEVWSVPVAALRSPELNDDPRLDWLRANLDQVVSDTLMVTIERYRDPVDFSSRVTGPREAMEQHEWLADTFIMIKDTKGDFEVWTPTDYAMLADLLARLPTIGSRVP